LRHLARSETRLNYKVIVVDNDSADGSAEMVEEEFPHVHVVRSGSNLGFGRGNNLGFRYAEGRHVLLLNPDAYITDPHLLSAVVTWLDRNGAFGALGCRLTFPDGRHQVGDAGYRPGTAAMIYSALGFTRLSSRFRGVFTVGRGTESEGPISVDWICGAFMLVRRDILQLVGGFDDRIFMYAEDVEWGCRARDLGVHIAYIPWREVVHVQNGTQYKDAPATVSTRWLDSLVMLHRRFGQRGSWQTVRLCMTFGFLARAIVYRVAAFLVARPTLGNKSKAMLTFARHTWSLGR
jgi:GT2 family glycosyltransferase